MGLPELLRELTRLGVRLLADGDRLRFRPLRVVTPAIESELRTYKRALLALVRSEPQPSGSGTQNAGVAFHVDSEITRLPYVCGLCRRRVTLLLLRPGMYSYRCVCDRDSHGKVAKRNYRVLLEYEALRQEQERSPI